MVTAEEVAAQLNESEYPVRVPVSLSRLAKAAGIVIVFGASDDLMEFEGAIYDEFGCNDGGTAMVSENGLMPDFDSIDKDDKDALRSYFASEGKGKAIEAVWAEGEYSWTYKTDIPHATFEVVERWRKVLPRNRLQTIRLRKLK